MQGCRYDHKNFERGEYFYSSPTWIIEFESGMWLTWLTGVLTGVFFIHCCKCALAVESFLMDCVANECIRGTAHCERFGEVRKATQQHVACLQLKTHTLPSHQHTRANTNYSRCYKRSLVHFTFAEHWNSRLIINEKMRIIAFFFFFFSPSSSGTAPLHYQTRLIASICMLV